MLMHFNMHIIIVYELHTSIHMFDCNSDLISKDIYKQINLYSSLILNIFILRMLLVTMITAMFPIILVMLNVVCTIWIYRFLFSC